MSLNFLWDAGVLVHSYERAGTVFQEWKTVADSTPSSDSSAELESELLYATRALSVLDIAKDRRYAVARMRSYLLLPSADRCVVSVCVLWICRAIYFKTCVYVKNRSFGYMIICYHLILTGV